VNPASFSNLSDLWEWIDVPYEIIPKPPKPVQDLPPFKGFGQQ